MNRDTTNPSRVTTIPKRALATLITHDELVFLQEAATAGYHGALTRLNIYACFQENLDVSADRAYYHARMAGRAALRVMDALIDGEVRI